MKTKNRVEQSTLFFSLLRRQRWKTLLYIIGGVIVGLCGWGFTLAKSYWKYGTKIEDQRLVLWLLVFGTTFVPYINIFAMIGHALNMVFESEYLEDTINKYSI